MRNAVGPLTTLEKVILAFAMTWAAGFVDLIGYISLYGLYTSNMTGNTVGMARHISQLDWAGVVRHGWPILTFVFGLMLGSFIYEAEKRRKIQVPFPSAIGLEVLFIGIFIAAGIGSHFKADIPPQPAGKFFAMVALLATAMGIQNVVLREVGGLNVYTTFVTGSLVKFAESLSQYLLWLRDRTRGRFRSRFLKAIRISPRIVALRNASLTFGLWAIYLTGAVCGGFSLQRWALLAMLTPFALLTAVTLYGVFRPFLALSSEER
ncbi:MAG TPA: YoaK family protein [Candidatus Sulfotelmatobacter sp.]|nr:YoaK family protein [Candidatus Sulfotelmatobacter sp.]